MNNHIVAVNKLDHIENKNISVLHKYKWFQTGLEDGPIRVVYLLFGYNLHA